MKIKMAKYSLLLVFMLSLFAPFVPTGIAAEKPKPEQQENNILDDVKTGAKVTTGMTGAQVSFYSLLKGIEDGSATKGSIVVDSLLISTGLAKIVDDAAGDSKDKKISDSKLVKVSGYVGDAGGFIGSSIDAAAATSYSYQKVSSSGNVANPNLFKQFWQTTKVGIDNVKRGFTGLKNGSFSRQTFSTTLSNTTQHVKGLQTLNKLMGPLAIAGAGLDFWDAYTDSKDPEKERIDVTGKIISGISNLLIAGAFLAAGTAGAPILAVAALVTGAVALGIKYRGPIINAYNAVRNKVSDGLNAAGRYLKAKGIAFGKSAKDAWKSGISKAKVLGSKAKAAINKGISKAKAFGAKAGSAIKKTAGKAYQFFKTKAGQAKKGLSKAAKTISSATKKAWTKTQSAVSKAKKSVTAAVKKTFSKGAKAFSNAKKTISAAAKKTYSKAKKTITSAAKKVVGRAKSAISKVTKPFGTAKKAVSKAKKTITAAAKKATKKAHSYTKKVTKSVSSASKKAYSYAKKATSTVKKAASKPVSYAKKAVTSAKSAAKSTYSYAKKAASTVKKTVSKSVSSYGKKVSSAVKSTASKSYSYVNKTASSAGKAVKSVASTAKKKVSSVAKGVTSFFKKPKFRW